MELTIIILSILTTIGVLLPFSKSKHWFVRGQASFRAFYLVSSLVLLILVLMYLPFSIIKLILAIMLPVSLFVCLRSISPYTIMYPKTIKDAKSEIGKNIKLYIHNVYQFNGDYGEEIDTILEEAPDVILLLEINNSWDQALVRIQKKYKYEVKEVREDTYGIVMLSKIEPINAEVNHFVKTSIPSTEMLLDLDGNRVRILGIHPEPPIPGEVLTSIPKDDELKSSARYLNSLPDVEHKILIGDLNDVAWSRVSKKFKQMTGMKDVRVGRGFFSTFPTYSPVQIPLDHVFCTPEIEIVEFKTIENEGSDHHAVSVTFQIPEKATSQNPDEIPWANLANKPVIPSLS